MRPCCRSRRVVIPVVAPGSGPAVVPAVETAGCKRHEACLRRLKDQSAKEGVLLFATCGGVGGGGRTAPFGGREGIMGTNPIAIGLPAGARPPMIVDFATTVVAEGKVQVARAKGVDLPPGAIMDKHGRPSVNPNDLYDGGTMLTFGGHKGFGLALVAAVLSQGLTGSRGQSSRSPEQSLWRCSSPCM